MDRAQVLAWDADKFFHLPGSSPPSPRTSTSELKRFGIRIGKFVYGDSDMYERNRMFVYQYLMELYGFPIVSERALPVRSSPANCTRWASVFSCASWARPTAR